MVIVCSIYCGAKVEEYTSVMLHILHAGSGKELKGAFVRYVTFSGLYRPSNPAALIAAKMGRHMRFTRSWKIHAPGTGFFFCTFPIVLLDAKLARCSFCYAL